VPIGCRSSNCRTSSTSPSVESICSVADAPSVSCEVHRHNRNFTAHPNNAERYFSRLFAAPGLSAFRSINIMTTAALTCPIGQSAIFDLEPGFGGSRRHSSSESIGLLRVEATIHSYWLTGLNL
jgi:hypothetical protein